MGDVIVTLSEADADLVRELLENAAEAAVEGGFMDRCYALSDRFDVGGDNAYNLGQTAPPQMVKVTRGDRPHEGHKVVVVESVVWNAPILAVDDYGDVMVDHGRAWTESDGGDGPRLWCETCQRDVDGADFGARVGWGVV